MEVTEEQIASDIVRNLSEALAKMCEAKVEAHVTSGYALMIGVERKLHKWIEKL